VSVKRVLEVTGLALGFLLAFAVIAIPAQAAVSITIDKNTQTMVVAVDGVTKYTWPVSSGLPAYETPSGAFKAFRMEADHYSKEWDDAPMPHSIFFTKQGHAIHGTDAARNIGNPASHGCVRLSRENAATLFALVEEQGVLNTTVTLSGSATTALARRKTEGTNVASAGSPRQIVPQGSYQGQPARITRNDESDVVYGVDQWGRTVAMRQRRVYGAQSQSYDTQAYEVQQAPRTYGQPYYAPQPGGYAQPGYRSPYYAPRRGLFAEGW
jgi:hypothetical protein